MNFLTLQDMVLHQIGTKFYRHTQGPYHGREYTMIEIHPSKQRVKVEWVGHDGRWCQSVWNDLDVENKHLMMSYDQYLMATSHKSQRPAQHLPRGTSKSPSLSAPYGQSNMPAIWEDLKSGMTIFNDSLQLKFEVTSISCSNRGVTTVELTVPGSGMSSRTWAKADYIRYDWFEVPTLASTMKQSIQQATAQMAQSAQSHPVDFDLNPCAEIALDTHIQVKRSCNHKWFRDYISMFDSSMDKFSCSICGVKKEDV